MKINRFGRAYRFWRHAGCFGVVGAGIQGGAAAMATHKMNREAQAELRRQRVNYQEPALNIVKGSAAASGSEAGKRSIEQGTQQAMQNYAQIGDTPASVASSRGTSMGSSKGQNAWADLVGATRAPLQGYNQFELDQQIKNLRAAQQLGLISQLSSLSAQAGPLEVKDAANSMQWMNSLGSQLAAGGNSGMMAAGIGG
jgi:hypothetical protein